MGFHVHALARLGTDDIEVEGLSCVVSQGVDGPGAIDDDAKAVQGIAARQIDKRVIAAKLFQFALRRQSH